ncbi:hypothetical protein TNCV_3410141 [Trichonephila clavipes]|nr:hypothetical protein TNCV_3410141 [Trichonephila clavipes]
MATGSSLTQNHSRSQSEIQGDLFTNEQTFKYRNLEHYMRYCAVDYCHLRRFLDYATNLVRNLSTELSYKLKYRPSRIRHAGVN